MPTSDYEFEYRFGVLIIYDLDHDHMSVTNNIETVLQQINKRFTINNDMKIIYRDSNQIFDGIHHDRGKFQSFYSINETTLEKALLKITQEDTL